MRLKSKCLAVSEVLRLGQASIINKGALLAIVFKSIKSSQTREPCAPRGPGAVGPLAPGGPKLTQAGFVLISAASGPPHRPLLSCQRSLVYKCPQPPQLKIVTKKNSTETQRKGPGHECALEELFQADSAALSKYYLNGFQLQGWPPRLTREFS